MITESSLTIENLILQDPGNRGVQEWGVRGELFPAMDSLNGGDHIIITTGFYILTAGAIETDGPSGAIILADALIKLGKEVTIITDDHAKDIIQAGMDVIGCSAELITFKSNEELNLSSIIKMNTTHFIALERPGKAVDGVHYNFRGLSISDYTAPIDELYIDCSNYDITTIAIGDGGNELGMGNCTNSHKNSCRIKSDYCICAGVSNWAGYAAAGILSEFKRENFLPEFEKYSEILEKVVEAGAVDGVSGKKEATVDGLEREWEDKIYNTICKIVEENL